MHDPLDLTIRQLMDHSRKEYRNIGYEAAYQLSMSQLEEQARSIPMYVEKKCSSNVIKDNFRPLS